MLLGVHLEHQLPDRAMQPRDRSLQYVEARARDPGGRLEIDTTQRGAEIDMVLHREIERARRSPAAYLDVLVGRAALRYLGAREVRDHAQKRLDLLLQGGERCLVGLQLLADAADFLEHGRGVLALALEHADLLGERVALRLQLLGAQLQLAALVLERAEARRVEFEAAPLKAGDDRREFFSEQLDIEHASF